MRDIHHGAARVTPMANCGLQFQERPSRPRDMGRKERQVYEKAKEATAVQE